MASLPQASSRDITKPNGTSQTSQPQQKPTPVPPGPDMYDPRLLVEVIRSGGPDAGERRRHRHTRRP